MSIANYLKIIGRGKEGARALTLEQAQALMGLILDGAASDLEIGAFCVAMRIKGETPDELCGFLDAIESRIQRVPAPVGTVRPVIILPSYNGARRLPLLTPLLALLLAREGFCVLIHGTITEPQRLPIEAVLARLEITADKSVAEAQRAWTAADAGVHFIPTVQLQAGLQRLLDARLVIGLRNPAHSLVKLMNPCVGPSVLVSSYTHPQYAQSMGEVLQLRKSCALLMRGVEGEAVADPRRTPAMRSFFNGQVLRDDAGQSGTLTALPDLPQDCTADSSALYTQRVLDGSLPVPQPIALQVARIVELANQPFTG